MGMMPEGRARRWQSIFRRYGIATDAETNTPQEADALEKLKEQAQDALLPGVPREKENKPRRPSRRAR